MVGPTTERELRRELAEARLRPEDNPRHARIFRAVRSIMDVGSVYHVLTDTPEQMEDVFRILVDDTVVVGFELQRDSSDASPTEVQQYSVQDYRKAIGGRLSKARLRIALELAQRELESKAGKGPPRRNLRVVR
jgi:hypothetical protein